MRKVFHYKQNRALTCRELARIQTFQDDFIFLGSSIQIQQQIGNAVPPKLAFLLGKQIKEALANAQVS
ncbi:MAG: DNA cytosine methyltransferase [Lachnospirales bacterium]